MYVIHPLVYQYEVYACRDLLEDRQLGKCADGMQAVGAILALAPFRLCVSRALGAHLNCLGAQKKPSFEALQPRAYDTIPAELLRAEYRPDVGSVLRNPGCSSVQLMAGLALDRPAQLVVPLPKNRS
jgi:hypothetical protein